MTYLPSNDYEIDHENDYEIKHNCLSEEGANAAYMMTSLFNSPSSLSSSSTAAVGGPGVGMGQQPHHHQMPHPHHLAAKPDNAVDAAKNGKTKSNSFARKQTGKKQQMNEAKVKIESDDAVSGKDAADSSYHISYHGQQIPTHPGIVDRLKNGLNPVEFWEIDFVAQNQHMANMINSYNLAGIMNDSDLVNLPLRELNKRLRFLPKQMAYNLKKRRRTLKNRKYAQNCRSKRLEQKSEMEIQNTQLKQEIVRLNKQIDKLSAENVALKSYLDSSSGANPSSSSSSSTTGRLNHLLSLNRE